MANLTLASINHSKNYEESTLTSTACESVSSLGLQATRTVELAPSVVATDELSVSSAPSSVTVATSSELTASVCSYKIRSTRISSILCL